jgi:ADP-ribose pyrophosphatase
MSNVSTNWKTVSKKIILKNKYLEVWEDDVLLPDGNHATYYVQRREPFSVIIPIENETIYMVRQYRYPVSSLSLEFCMGYAEGKNPVQTAETELREEMGVKGKELVQIGRLWYGPGRTSQEVYVYVAKGLEFGKQELEEGEFIDVEKHTISEVGDMIEKGEILDGPTITAYHYLENYLKKNNL